MDKFTKQPYEKFPISVDFSKNFADGETIATQTATAVDKDGVDASTDVLDATSNDGSGIVFVPVKDGDITKSKYKITVRCVTSANNQWELDVQMAVEEI
ncbi:hypothetical protein KA005_74565 [bacterium]|nr:hypothetical protein [bacterium]